MHVAEVRGSGYRPVSLSCQQTGSNATRKGTMMDRSFAMGNSMANGPQAPGKREQHGMPPPPVTSWALTGWADPE